MNIDQPQITTIICTYRRPQMLRRAIESVLNQTYQDFQICVYDNASGDDTAAVVAEFAQQDFRIKYHCHPENIGLLANYSYGLREINTPFFSYLADDDVILPNFFSVALAEFEKEPQAFYVATSFISLSFQGNKVGTGQFPSKVFQPPDGVFQFVESGVNPNLHGVLIRKEVIKDFNEFVYIWDDIDLLYRVAAAHPIVLSSEECLLSITHNMDKGRKVTIDHAWLPTETIGASLKPILSSSSYSRLNSIFQKSIQSALYALSIELIYDQDFIGAKTGANKLKKEYALHHQALILEFLIFLFKISPPLLKLFRSTRDLRPYIKRQKEKYPIFSYSQIINIYHTQKY
jgi:glycosyltransferase involved in cell wall biosynthesis